MSRKALRFPFNSLSRIEFQLGEHKMQYAPQKALEWNFFIISDKKLKIKRDEAREKEILKRFLFFKRCPFTAFFFHSILFCSPFSECDAQPMNALLSSFLNLAPWWVLAAWKKINLQEEENRKDIFEMFAIKAWVKRFPTSFYLSIHFQSLF